VNPVAPSALPAVGDWFLLPTGRTVSIRAMHGEGFQTECVVRYVDERGAMSTGEFSLSISYVVRGRRIGRD
jgi:hypothetical protein